MATVSRNEADFQSIVSYTHSIPTPANLPLHISLSRTQPNNLREELTLEHFAVVGADKPHNSKMRVDRSDLIVIPFSVSTYLRVAV